MNKVAQHAVALLYIVRCAISKPNKYTSTGFNWRSTRCQQANGSLCIGDAVLNLHPYKSNGLSKYGLAVWALEEVLGTNQYGVLNEPDSFKEALIAIDKAILLFDQDILTFQNILN
jgi:hypothetical protein